METGSRETTLFHGARKLDANGQVDEFWMLVAGNTIAATGTGSMPSADERVDVQGDWLVPGFIDLHCHGGGGHSFDAGIHDMAPALAVHRAHGTTRSVLSLAASSLSELRRNLGSIAGLAERDPLVLGSHLEGPFLSMARRGAHDPDHLRSPVAAEVKELISASRGTLRQVTIAPELPGALKAIELLNQAGVVVAIGHTTAGFELTKEAFERGARVLTHAFNAMAGIHHREPGPIIAAFGDERVVLELVLDGIHVHPDVASLAFVAAPGRVALVTDAMVAAGASEGDYRIGSLEVTVNDGRAVLRGTDTLAGSTLTQDVAIRCAVTQSKVQLVDAVAAATSTPARALGLDHRFGYLAPGYAADAVILDHRLHVRSVWANGHPVDIE